MFQNFPSSKILQVPIIKYTSKTLISSMKPPNTPFSRQKTFNIRLHPPPINFSNSPLELHLNPLKFTNHRTPTVLPIRRYEKGSPPLAHIIQTNKIQNAALFSRCLVEMKPGDYVQYNMVLYEAISSFSI